MMYQMKKLPYNYIPEHGVQILELPYVEEELSMFILLPEETADGPSPLLKVQHVKTKDRFFLFRKKKSVSICKADLMSMFLRFSC